MGGGREVAGMTPEPLVLVWREDGLELSTARDGRLEARGRLALAVMPHQRYDLRLRLEGSGQGWLRAPVGPRALVVRIEEAGRRMLPLPPLPGERPLSLPCAQLQARGTVTVLDGETLHVLGAERSSRTYRLPAGATIQGVSLDEAGRLWLAGGAPSAGARGGSKAVLFRQGMGVSEFEPVPMAQGLLARMRVQALGGGESFQRVDAESAPIVATSDCAWLFDDLSTFVFVSTAAGRWSVKRLAGHSVRMLLRDGAALRVCTAAGEVLTWSNGGFQRSGPAQALREALQAAAPEVPPSAVLSVRGAHVARSCLCVVAGLYVQEGNAPLRWWFNAACVSRDAGASWEVLAGTRPVRGEAELLDAALPDAGDGAPGAHFVRA